MSDPEPTASSKDHPAAPIEVPEAPADVRAAFEALGVALEPGDEARLRAFLRLLLEANRVVNLTAIRDPEAAWRRHVLDGLSLVGPLASIEFGRPGPLRVADLGSGGGVPGLVLACVMPEVEFTLIEATRKKARHLERTAEALELANVSVVARRAEAVGQDADSRERFDAVLARAVGALPVLIELCVPLLRVGGLLLAVKGERAADEIRSARKALHALHALVTSSIPTETGTIVVVEKSRPTPRRYPRAAGVPAKTPL